MKCEKCGSVANSFCTIQENGQRREIYLCSACRKKILETQQEKKPVDISKDVFCHNCGVTLKDFMESGYVGCEHCYEQFGAMMHKAIVGCQKKIENLGKVPPRFERREKLNELNKLLERALFNNDLEQVNRISREIKALGGGR